MIGAALGGVHAKLRIGDLNKEWNVVRTETDDVRQ